MKPRRFNQLEVALRIKSPDGVLLSEHIIRGNQVELINYFPSGKMFGPPLDISLEQFVDEMKKLQSPYEASHEAVD